MDRKLYLHLQAGREVSGVLRGFDMFLNLVVENAFEELGGGVRKPLGMIVSLFSTNIGSHHGEGSLNRTSRKGMEDKEMKRQEEDEQECET